MKVLLLADVHGNLPALKAVLEAARDLACDEIWCLGDLVGYGPFPNEAARLVRARAAHVVAGNHDVKVVSSTKIAAIVEQQKEPYKVFIFTWTHRALATDVSEYLKALPEVLRLTVAAREVLLVHGSPAGMNDGLSRHTPLERLESLARAAAAEVILVGHTHDAFSREVSGTVFINPGSVGRPFDGDGRASFATLEFTGKGVHVDTHRVAYDGAPVVDEMRRQGFPRVLIQAFMEARSPAEVLPDGARGELVDEAAKLGARLGYERPHALQVCRLSLLIFDALAELHGYGARERALLQAGALLHDVGIVRGAQGHHKASRDIILEDRNMPLSDRTRTVMALVARYHRRSLPEAGHQYFSALPDQYQVMVERLGGILRLADGLDRTHRSLVKGLSIEVTPDAVTISLQAREDIRAEVDFAVIKSDLFERAFGRNVIYAQQA